ncbi:hypothetical protein QR680_011165 [Steinernema hermaphroditum]|uniref:Protein CLP1 homolog n=1 Tax=Steinernema hermaphroditum TaxID=289476 RepID=A0AA39MCD7_9BILA|nr:hypothetical protein QR680_011165 [Steinernema hermaphroditum]
MVQQFKLNEDNELRFDVVAEDVIIELLSGRAEVFGTELRQHEKYTFVPGMRVAVFSWTGATVEVSEEARNAYVAENNQPMTMYLNTHAGMEQMRIKAKTDKNGRTKGPRTMLVGPMDVGKSTVCRILTNYAVRMGHTPIYVDIDVGQGNVSVAGTIGALMVDRTADPVYGFDDRCAKVFQVGSTSPGTNIVLYNHLVEELANLVNEECERCPEVNKSGIIINTCGWVNGDGYKSLVNAAECFEVDLVVVLDQERLYTELKRDLPSFVNIVHHPKSGGVEARPSNVRCDNRRKSFHKYFYGTRQMTFNPYRIVIGFDDLIIAKIGTDRLPDSCIPHGMKAADSRMMVVRIEPSVRLINHVVAVTDGATMVDQTLLCAVAVGFIVIMDVSVENRQLSITCPQPCFPEGTVVGLLSDVTFADDEVRVH